MPPCLATFMPRSCHVVSRVVVVECAAGVLYVKVPHKANQVNQNPGAGAAKKVSIVSALEATLLRCGIVPGPCRLAPLSQADRGRRGDPDSCSDDEVRVASDCGVVSESLCAARR